ncbi:MAG: class I SAM-dependent methyltransferase [Acidobacteriota bacterium]
MKLYLPDYLEEIILHKIKKIDTIKLSKYVYSLTEDLIEIRESYFNDERKLLGYFAFFFPQSYLKLKYILEEIDFFFPEQFANPTQIICDIGSGIGPSTISLYDFFKKRNIGSEIFSIEKNKNAFEFQNILLEECLNLKNNSQKISLKNKSLEELVSEKKEKFTLIVLSLVLGEVLNQRGKRKAFNIIKEAIKKLLDENGILIIVEPATHSNSRNLINFRDEIIKSNPAYPILPCFHKNTCSIFPDKDDWCISTIPWEPPDFMKEINKYLWRDIGYLKFSYLVLKKGKFSSDINYLRALTPFLKEKGKGKVVVCSEKGKKIFERLERDQSESNREIETTWRGAVLGIENYEKKANFFRLKKDSKVKIFTF